MWGHDEEEVPDFRGLFARGQPETCPPGFATVCSNIRFSEHGIESREGSELVYSLAFNPARLANYKKVNEGGRIIALDAATGKLYDLSVSLTVPILTIAGMVDFSLVTMFDRAYITPHDGDTGLTGEFLYVYSGSGTARKAAGTPPTGFNLIGAEPAAGKVEKGNHLIAIAYRTDSGYITRPGPTGNYLVFNSAGAKNLVITTSIPNMPVGPAGTAARVFLASRVLDASWNGDIMSPELFFVPGGEINNNNAGVVNITLDFYDSDLIDSADYLADNHDTIPATLGLTNYNGNLVGWTRFGDSSIWVAKNGQPESLSQTDGFIIADPGVGTYVRNCWQYRGLLYVQKSFGPTYVTINNGDAPSSWSFDMIDSVMGAEVHSVAEILDNRGVAFDRQIIANRLGLFLFDGTFQSTELSYNISDQWTILQYSTFKKTELKIDPQRMHIYVLFSDGTTSVLLVADYAEGLSADKIKWTTMSFASGRFPLSILVNISQVSQQVRVYLAGNGAQDVIRMLDGSRNDLGAVAISSQYYTHFFGRGSSVNHFLAARSRVTGVGQLQLTTKLLDTTTVLQATIALSNPFGAFQTNGFNVVSERVRLHFDLVNTLNNWFRMTKLSVFSKEWWTTRPGW